MNIEKMQSLWKSAENTPSREQAEQVAVVFATHLRRRYTVFKVFLVWLFTVLTLFTGLSVYNLLITRKVTIQEDWMLLPMMVIPWLFAIVFLVQFLRHKRAHGHFGESITSALRASLDENQMACSRMQRVGLAYLVSIPVFGLAIRQLYHSGKMDMQEIASMLTLFGVALGIAGSWTAYRYFRKLAPRKRMMESLLRQYE